MMAGRLDRQAPSHFTAQAVWILFSEKVLNRDDPPTLEACAEVARLLTTLRAGHQLLNDPSVVESRRAFDDWRSKIESGFSPIRDALQDMEKAIPAFETSVQTVSEIDDRYHSAEIYKREVLEALAGFQTAKMRLEGLIGPSVKVAEWGWLNDALTLGYIFRIAMRSIHPEREYGLSDTGPLVKFIHHSLILCYDLRIEPTAIKTALIRARKAGTA